MTGRPDFDALLAGALLLLALLGLTALLSLGGATAGLRP